MTATVRLKWLLRSIDERAGTLSEILPLLAVSIHWGVRRRDYVTGDRPRVEDLTRYRICKDGDLVLNRMRAFQGALGIAPCDGLVSPDYSVFRPAFDCDRRWLVYMMKAPHFLSDMTSRLRGIGGTESGVVRTPRINEKDLLDIGVDMPSLDEQRQVVDFLDHETAQIDALVAKQQQLIAGLRERRSTVLALAFADLPHGATQLRHVADIQTGVTLSGSRDMGQPEWPYLRVANVQTGYVDLGHITTLRLDPAGARAAMLRAGDVLVTEGGDIDKLGRGAMWCGEIEPMLHQNHVFAVRPSARLSSEFLVLWLDAPVAREYFYTTAKKTTNLASTNKTIVGRLPVTLPPIEMQRELVVRVTADMAKIGALTAKAEEFIALARERRAALITEAVTGRIDVSTGKTREGA